MIGQLPSTTSRFKFCWLRNAVEGAIIDLLDHHGIPTLNIGKRLSNCIDPSTSDTDLSLQVARHLSDLLTENATKINSYDVPVVAIYNIGITKEPKLNIKFENILKDICRSKCVILIWDGEFREGNFIQESDLNSEVYLSFSQPLIELSL